MEGGGMTTMMLPEADPWENPVVEFDFTGELASVDSATVSIEPGGAGLLDGALQITGAVVYQRVKSDMLADKTNYYIRCQGTGGVDRRVRAAYIPARKA
jgi:hypothetical protein